MKKINLLLLFSLFVGLTACEKTKIDENTGAFDKGIFVVNEGQFMHGNASLSFTDEKLSQVENDIYKSVNHVDLGDQAQSIGFAGDNAYIVVTGSNKIEVTKANTMEKVVTIASGLTNPRYFETISSSTALVSCWGDPSVTTDDYLAIVNTNSNEVTGQIPVELGPEKMVKNTDYLFVAHQGAWGTNHKVSVYDLILKQITNVITVGDRPNSMVIKGNFLWVLCGGEPSWTGNETAGQLYKIDINNNFNVVATYDFAVTEHPKFLNLDGDNLYYYLNQKVYKMPVTATTLPTGEFLTYSGNAYNMETYKGKLYITDALDYQQEGTLTGFDLSNGQVIGTQSVGLIPGDLGFHFN